MLYYFIDSKAELTSAEIHELIKSAGIEDHEIPKVIEFLLYYGIFGVKTNAEDTHYIFGVNYDLKVLQIRAQRTGANVLYVMNPAFRPALAIQD